MITLDGSRGEGGGQILRTGLGLALVTGAPLRIERIRAGRERPGLMRQHRAAVLAAAEIGDARVDGAELGSLALEFHPGRVSPGDYRFAIGSAGSATLVLQTVLPALVRADAPSRIVLEGGTHNPFAPPFDFLARSFLPVLARVGPRVEMVLERHGFYPAGGGRIVVTITPAPLAPLELLESGARVSRRATAIVAHLPEHIGERELAVVRSRLGWLPDECHLVRAKDSAGPGNALVLELASEHVTEVVTGFGERDVPAGEVAVKTVRELRAYLAHGAPVGEHLADQLLLPCALAGGGVFVTCEPSNHTRTNAEVVEQLTGVATTFEPHGEGKTLVRVGKP